MQTARVPAEKAAVLLCLLLVLSVSTAHGAKCTSLFDLAVYGRPCAKDAAPCFDRGATLESICTYRGQCRLVGVSDVSGDTWTCDQCRGDGTVASKCMELYPDTSQGGGSQQQRGDSMATRVAFVLTHPSAARPSAAAVISDPVADGTIAMTNFSGFRAPRFVAWLGGTRSGLSVGVTTPVFGMPTGPQGHLVMGGYYPSPRPVVVNATRLFRQSYFAADDGARAAANLAIVIKNTHTTQRVYSAASLGVGQSTVIAPRVPGVRLWPSRDGPAVELLSGTSALPPSAMGRLPVVDDSWVSAPNWTLPDLRPQRATPAMLQISVGGSAYFPVPVLNRRHNIFVAGSDDLGLLYPQSSPVNTEQRPDISLVATPSGALIDAFTNAASDTSVKSPGIHSAYDDEAAPLEVVQVADVGIVWYLANGNVRVLPLANATGFSSQSFAFAALKAHMTFEHRVAAYGKLGAIVYRPGAKTVRAFGRNIAGRFADGSLSNDLTFDGSRDITLNFDSAEEGVANVALSDRHMVVVSTVGLAYFAGATSWTGAACLPIGSPEADSFTLRRLGTFVNVRQAAVGSEFTVILLAGASAENTLHGCGGKGYMAPATSTVNVTVKYAFFFLTPGNTIVNVCSGAYYACAHRSDGVVGCWGSQSPVANTSSGPTGVALMCWAGSLQPASFDPIGNAANAFVAETVSCGHQHVTYTSIDGGAGNASLIGVSPLQYATRFGIDAYAQRRVQERASLRSVKSCGSNQMGQLGYSADLDYRDGVHKHPILATREGVASSFDYKGATIADDRKPLQLVAGAVALGNNTVIITRERIFQDPSTVLRTYGSVLQQYPPDGYYRLTSSSGFRNADWKLDFSTLPGVALLVAANVSSASSWLAPAGNLFMTVAGGSDVIGTNGAFARDISTVNLTFTAPRDTFDNRTRQFTRRRRDTIFHFFILGSGGYVRNVTSLYQCPPPAVNALCDNVGAVSAVVWATAGTSVPAGYSDGNSLFTWLALAASVETVTINDTITVNITDAERRALAGKSAVPNASDVAPFLPAWAAMAAYETNVLRKRAALQCIPVISVHECTTASWVEAWARSQSSSADNAVSSSGPLGWPVGGITAVLDPKPPSVTLGSLQIRPMVHRNIGMTAMNIPQGVAEDALGISNVCIFMAFGTRYYYIRLMPNGDVLICSQGTATRTRTASKSFTWSLNQVLPPNPPIATPVQVPAKWEMMSDDILRITNFEPNVFPVEGKNFTFEMTCAGGLRLTDNGVGVRTNQDLNSYDSSVFLLTTNASIGDLFDDDPAWFRRDTRGSSRNASVILRKRTHGPLGCDGGYVTGPISGTIAFTRLVLTFRVSTAFRTSGDRVVIELLGKGMDPRSGVRHRFQFHFQGVEVFDIRNGRGSADRATVPGFTCQPVAVSLSDLNTAVFDYDRDTATTVLHLNDRPLCSGTLFDDAQVSTLSGVYLGILNPYRRVTTAISFREIVACDTRHPASKVFGCTVNGKRYDYPHKTATRTVPMTDSYTHVATDTATASDSQTKSLTLTRSPTLTMTKSLTVIPTPTDTMVPTDTASMTATPTVSSSISESATSTDTAIPFRYLYLSEFNADVASSTLLRRTGLSVKLSVAGDYFNFLQDWGGRAAGMLDVNSSVPPKDNPHGIMAQLRNEGFVTGFTQTNRSELTLQFGPYDGYHSVEGEVITFTLRPAGFASFLPAPNSVTIAIPGEGSQVVLAVAALESATAFVCIAGIVMGAPPSLMSSMTRSTLSLNYHCFGGERTRISFLLHPFQTDLNGSEGLAIVIANLVLLVGLVLAHLAAVLIVRIVRPHLHWYYCMGLVYFPSFTVCLCMIPAASLIVGSFRYAFEGDLDAARLLFPILCVAGGIGTLAYLYSVLYDDSNFCAHWEPYPEEALALRRRHYPIMDAWALPGFWEPIDRQLSFHRRLHFLFQEFTPRRRYFLTIDLAGLLIESCVMGIAGATLAVCSAQMLVVAMLRAVLLVCAVHFRPFNTRVGLPLYLILNLLQLLTASTYAAYVVTNFTNTLRTVTRVVLLASVATLISLVAIVTGFSARLWCLKFTFNRQVAQSAKKVYAPTLKEDYSDEEEDGDAKDEPSRPNDEAAAGTGSPLLQLPRRRGAGDPEQDLDFTKGSDGRSLGAATDDSGAQPVGARPRLDLDFGPLLDSGSAGSFSPVSRGNVFDDLLGPAPAAGYPAPTSDHELDPNASLLVGPGERSAMLQGAASSAPVVDDVLNISMAPSKKVKAKPPKGPSVWRVIALEEATDRQCDPVPIFDEDLL
jgi:hypothetical protein